MSEDFLCDEETLDDIPDMEQFSEETLDDILDMVDFSEEIKGMLEDVNDMLEEIGLDELLDSPVSGKGDMDPADIKAMKIKHRNKEMKDIVKADAEYLKAVFEGQLEWYESMVPFAGTMDCEAAGQQTLCWIRVQPSDMEIETVNDYQELRADRKSTRLNSSHNRESRMPSSA